MAQIALGGPGVRARALLVQGPQGRDLAGEARTFDARPRVRHGAAIEGRDLRPEPGLGARLEIWDGGVVRIGVAALSGPCERFALERGCEELRRLGLEPVLAANLRGREAAAPARASEEQRTAVDPTGLYAGLDEERLNAFHQLLRDGRLDGLIFARGGHGLLRLLPKVDWSLLSRAAKNGIRLCGYSDLTPLLNEVVRRTGSVALHGPMVAAELAHGLDDREAESLLRGLGGADDAEHPMRMADGDGLRGNVSGPLLGGCLSLLAAVLGTPWQIPSRGALLLCEDVGEPLYRRDRMLTQLMLSHSLNGVKAILFGSFCGGSDAPDRLWHEIATGHARQAATTLAWGLEAGHARPNLTLPLGAPATLRADGVLSIGRAAGGTS